MELILSFGILAVVLMIALFSAPHITFHGWGDLSLTQLLLPYGVLLFAFHGATSIPEAHALLRQKDRTFARAIVIAGGVAIVVYVLFASVVLGVTGSDTTEIATIGLGQKIGPSIFLLGNLFAALAMSTSFLMAGLSLSNSLRADFRMPRPLALRHTRDARHLSSRRTRLYYGY